MEIPQKIRRYGKRPKNKEATKRLLLDAVGDITRTEGYTALGINNIALKADVDKVLIYRYFGGLENLLETHIREKDYWQVASKNLRAPVAESNGELEEIATGFLENQFDLLMENPAVRELVHWEISGKSEIVKGISSKRELVYRDLLKRVVDNKKGGGTNLRMLMAALSAGLSFMIIHKDAGPFYGIDLNDPAQAAKFKATIGDLIALVLKKKER